MKVKNETFYGMEIEQILRVGVTVITKSINWRV